MNLGIQLLCMALGYAIGSFPTAMLVLRGKEESLRANTDGTITSLWRGTNLQAAYIIIIALDVAKGILAVKVGMLVQGDTFIAPALAGFFATLGHNYNFIFRNKAEFGRGLPVVLGVMGAVNPVPVLVFVVCALTGYLVVRRNIYMGIFTGCLATPILMYNAPDQIGKTFMLVPCENVSSFKVFVFLLCLQIAVRHFEQFRLLFNDDEGGQEK
jgi:acyl phosphate:glycerol-3-phosphate acyltransferase